MIIHDKTIAIVGGGPGGLTLARLLQLKDAHVTVYERDTNRSVRVQGATLDLHEESGLEALRRAGLIDAFYTHYRPDAGKLRIMDKDTTIRMDDHSSDGHGENRPEIDRGPLRDILIDSLKPGTIAWDKQFVSMQKAGEGWLLAFRDGTLASADIVIAADGAQSKIRPYLSTIKPVYSGITIVEGTVYAAKQHAPQLEQIVKGGKVFAFGGSQSLILSAKGDGSLCFYTGCKVPEDWVQQSNIDFGDKASVLKWFRSAFGNWSPVWQELFSGAEISFIPRPQYHFPLDQQWPTLPNISMLGDAAHRMPPYAGEGVNMAMQDAYELAECLCSEEFDSVHAALSVYEKQMLQRAAAITQITLESTEMLHSEQAIDRMLQLFEGK